jgi:hypothetical protein
MPELNGEMFKRFIMAFVMFLVFAFTLGVFYEIVSTSVTNSLTGNWQYDMLIYIIPLAFAGGVIMILYQKYIPKDGDN